MKQKFRDFESAREFVRKLNLKNAEEWRVYCTSGNRPDYITSVPERVYKNNGWVGLGDWLGTGTPSRRNRKYRSFEDAKKFAHKLKLKSESQWNEYCASGNKPDDIPQSAKRIYKNEYKSMGDWLGTGRVADQKKIFFEFKEAREFVRNLGLKNHKEWENYCKSGNKPDDIPTAASQHYKNKGWKNWGDFLGTGNISKMKQKFRPFKEAREFVRNLGLKGQKEWIDYCKSGNKPNDIPSNPQQTYNKRWKRK